MSKDISDLIAKYSQVPEFADHKNISATSISVFGNSLLNIVAACGTEEEVSALLRQHVDIDHGGAEGYTPLHDAVEQDNSKVVSLLLKSGANFRIRNDFGVTALELARLLDNKDLASKIADYEGK